MLPSELTHGEPADITVEVTGTATGGTTATLGGTPVLLVGTDDLAGDSRSRGRYRISGAVPVDPTVRSRVEEWIDYNEPRCPDCGGVLQYESPVDLPDGVAPAGEDRPLLVAGDDATIERLDDEDTVDDWQGQPNDDRVGGRGNPLWDEDSPVTLVCVDCGRSVDPAEHEPGDLQPADARDDSGMGALANEALDAAPAESGVMQTQASVDAAAAPESADLGMATGGAKDATNFRDNVAEGYTPHPEALAYEGLFYDYYFDTGEGDGGSADEDGNASEDALFYPTYSAAVSADPLAGDSERYLTVGLNSTLTAADFERERLNLVAVLDVSGSMSSPFDEYYYDEHGRRRETDADDETKIEAAREALAALTTHLDEDDRFGVVLYNSRAHVAKPLRDVGSTDMDAIRSHIREVRAGGGTDLSAGFRAGRDLLADGDGDPAEVENRIVFLTDAMPNLGDLGEDDLVGLVEDAAEDGVHTTFVGMGIDASADLVDALSAVRGANHYFVHSAAEFERRLDEEFEYMVTPLVFDLSLDVVADGYELAGVYGSPDADAATGEVMHVPTLFPSPAREGETRGGVVLLELEATGTDPELELVATWEERDGSRHRDAVGVEFPASGPEYFGNDGVRKAVLLARYAELLRDWAEAVREGVDTEASGRVDDWQPPEERRERSEWERESVPLAVPDEYADLFERFREHLLAEMDALGDEDLQQEVELLDELLGAS